MCSPMCKRIHSMYYVSRTVAMLKVAIVSVIVISIVVLSAIEY